MCRGADTWRKSSIRQVGTEHAEDHLREAELPSSLRGDALVGGHGEDQSAGDGVARQRRDDRRPKTKSWRTRVAVAVHEAVHLGPVPSDQVRQVPARRKDSRSGGREDDAARVGAVRERRAKAPSTSSGVNALARGRSSVRIATSSRCSTEHEAHALIAPLRDAREHRARARARSGVNSGWNVAATTLPCRTRTGSPRSVASTSTPGPTRRIRGARMKTAGSRPPSAGALDLADEGIQLSAVPVALDGDVDQAERFLRRGCSTSSPERWRPRRFPGSAARSRRKRARASSHGSISKNFQSVVDSPPGRMSPAAPRAALGRRPRRNRAHLSQFPAMRLAVA